MDVWPPRSYIARRSVGFEVIENFLSPYPDIEIEIFICHGFDVKADGRNGGDDFTDLDTRVVSTSERV